MISPRLPIAAAISGLALAALAQAGVGSAVSEQIGSYGTVVVLHDSDPAPLVSTGTFLPADHYSGMFVWEDSSSAQLAAFDVSEVRPAGDGSGKIVATGRGTYEHDAHFTFRMVITPETGSVTIFESDPSVSSFVTAGRHEGRLTPNGDVTAQWIGDDGKTGSLSLTAETKSFRPASAKMDAARLQAREVCRSSSAQLVTVRIVP